MRWRMRRRADARRMRGRTRGRTRLTTRSTAASSPGCSGRSRSGRSAISTRRRAIAQVTLFPGSNLYERREKPRKGKPGEPTKIEAAAVDRRGRDRGDVAALRAHGRGDRSRSGSSSSARTSAHFRYTEPHWSAKAGRVLVTRARARARAGGRAAARRLRQASTRWRRRSSSSAARSSRRRRGCRTASSPRTSKVREKIETDAHARAQPSRARSRGVALPILRRAHPGRVVGPRSEPLVRERIAERAGFPLRHRGRSHRRRRRAGTTTARSSPTRSRSATPRCP